MMVKKVCILIGILIILILGCGVFYFKKAAVPTKTLVMARVDLQATLEKHPDWERYLELKTQIDKLRRKWSNRNAVANDGVSKFGAENIAELNKQVNTIEQNYVDESRLKLSNLNDTIKDYIKSKTEQLNAILKERLDSINNQLNKDLQNKARESEAKLQAYLTELQNDNQITLSNLQLQLSLLDISGNTTKIKEDKAKVQGEIARIKQDMEQKKAAKDADLQAELKTYADNKKKAAGTEFSQFKTENEERVKTEILAFRQKLESEYLSWKTNREQKMDSARKLRQDKLDQEYRQDKVRESILKSQQEQVREAIIWEIRQKTKRIAANHKIDCVLANDYLNINLRDLTGEIKKSLFQ